MTELLAPERIERADVDVVDDAAEFFAPVDSDVIDSLIGQYLDMRQRIEHVAEVVSNDHFATFPPDLIDPCIKASCPEGGTVLDCFGGSGTTGLVADRLGRNAILCELSQDYIGIAERRLAGDAGHVGRQISLDVAAADPTQYERDLARLDQIEGERECFFDAMSEIAAGRSGGSAT